MFSKQVARNMLQIQSQSRIVRQNSDGLKVKQRMKELKSMFGTLLETKREKVKRKKLELKNNAPVNQFSNINSEVTFMKNFKASNSAEIEFQKTNAEKSKKFSYRVITVGKRKTNFSSVTTKNTKGLTHFNDHPEIDFESNLQKNYDNAEIRATCSSNDHHDVTVENNLNEGIVTTPLFYNAKNKKDFDKSTEVLSLSSKDHKQHPKYPSVTRILSATMSEEAKELLDRWEKKMIAKLGIEEFRIYRQELLQNGKYMHSAIQSYLLHKPLDVHENVELAFKSVNNILKDISDVKAIESHVVHPQLHYRGYLDCIASYRGKLCLVDWKKSDKRKSNIMSTYDAPLQVASYIGALNADEKYPFEIQHGLIVVAYSNGDKATVHEISGDLLQLYWKSWLERLQKYRSEHDDAEIKSSL